VSHFELAGLPRGQSASAEVATSPARQQHRSRQFQLSRKRGAIYAGPTGANKGNKVVPTTLATPFGATIARQPGLATAMANGSMVVPTGIPFGFATPMAQGNMVGPATTTTPLSGGIRTRHGRTAGTSLSGALGGRLG
jgi:hypothetical protein